MAYFVVFENTDKTSAYNGTRTWTSFESKEEFETNYVPNNKEIVKPVKTTQEAINLCFAAKPNLEAIAEEEATLADGSVDTELAELHLKTNLLADFYMIEEQIKKAKDN